ncbi:DUF7373 family lipoprotein [Nocardia sp. NBC_01327]|uniref:DUF7373 family lipoprotein n=1 Tax=Nocardia sp. NBC_01327 TaxID=2903593 RepID=UPI002E15CB52|nr:hypothetical protein OG326_06850 [Nocardia sp. NBC_01327]
MKTHARRFWLLALVALSTALLTGCGSVSGTPVAGEIDIRKLDIGTYPIDPFDYRANYNPTPDNNQALAIMRLADHVADGLEIDPSLKFGRSGRAITQISDIDFLISEAEVPAVDRNHMTFGFSMSASTAEAAPDNSSLQRDVNKDEDGTAAADGTIVDLSVIQFPDAGSATKAAQEMDAADFAVADTNVAVSLDGYPDAKAHWRPGIPTLGATLAHGSYVIATFVKSPAPDLGPLTDMTRKALAAELPLLDQLPPLSARDLLHFRPDADAQAMFRRTLHPEDDQFLAIGHDSVLIPRGFLHRASQPEVWRDLMGAARVDKVSETAEGTQLMRVPDRAAAKKLEDGYGLLFKNNTDAPPGVPDSFCHESSVDAGGNPKTRFSCVVRYDRYVGRVFSAQLQDAHQRAAAQYALLTNSAWM